MPPLTHGPLPARVYWVRRLMVLGTAVLLVFAIARLLADGSDASSSGTGDGAARLSAGDASSSAPPTTSSSASSASVTPSAVATTSAAPVLAAPVGRCRGSDVAVTPTVANGVAGRDVIIALDVRTLTSDACTWRVSPAALTVTVTSGKDAIWNTRACPKAIVRQDVVVRKAVTTTIGVVWKDAMRSTAHCSPRPQWPSPGWYHVSAAALGGEPSDQQFELTRPVAATVTVTASPKQSPSAKATGKATGKATKKPGRTPSKTPTASPTGKVD
jgi:hypothetical protein